MIFGSPGYRRPATSPVQVASRGSVHSVFSARGMTPRDTSTSGRPEAGAGAKLAETTHARASSVSFSHQHPVTSITPTGLSHRSSNPFPTAAGHARTELG